jgi:hypothetical protein
MHFQGKESVAACIVVTHYVEQHSLNFKMIPTFSKF